MREFCQEILQSLYIPSAFLGMAKPLQRFEEKRELTFYPQLFFPSSIKKTFLKSVFKDRRSRRGCSYCGRRCEIPLFSINLGM
jgi:hypothetical protein